MREIRATEITQLVEKLCIEACYVLSDDIYCGLKKRSAVEKSPLGKQIIDTIVQNADIARNERCPICQDTGMTVVFVEMGQDVHVTEGFIEDAINQGVRQGYTKGYLRKSVVKDPIDRVVVSPKGFGSENKSGLKMLTPSAGIPGIKKFIIDTVATAGGNPCPPIIVGVGIGGTMERAAYLSKKALLRPVGSHSKNETVAQLETELLEEINRLGIGPCGFGGTTTALTVNILTNATHIAGLPVSVNIGCHATRHAEGEL